MSVIYNFNSATESATELTKSANYQNNSATNLISDLSRVKMFWDTNNKHVKSIDNNGAVNNSFLIEEPIPVNNTWIIILLAIIVALHLIALLMRIYLIKKKQLKKKYNNQQIRVNDRVV